MSSFYALTADLVDSRKVQDRLGFTDTNRRARVEATERFAEEWAAPLVPVKGVDEFTGVLRRPDRAFDVACLVNEVVWPQRFRFTLAVGTLDTPPVGAEATALDGPAFHRASETMVRAKKERLSFALWLPDSDPATVRVVEGAAVLHAAVMEDWTEVQWRTLRLYEQEGHQGKVAEELGITQQSVSETLRKARASEIQEIRSAIREWLKSSPQSSPA